MSTPRKGTALPSTPSHAPAAWGQVAGDVMQIWFEQLAQSQRTGLSMVEGQMRLLQGMQTGAATLLTGTGPHALHVMPDSAGPALCPPLDFSPAALTRNTLGTLQALTAAWTTAVQHELQDIDEITQTSSQPRH